MTHFMLILLINMPTPFGDMLTNMEHMQGMPFPTMEACVEQAEAIKKHIPDVSYVCVPETLAPEDLHIPKTEDMTPPSPKEQSYKTMAV